MSRLIIMTVGITHSGKTTFAKDLEKHLHSSVVIDQDNHAEFINTYYKSLLPKEGPNTLKTVVTRTVLDYAIKHTNCHIILCNSNRNQKDRAKLLTKLHDRGFTSILVYFNIAEHILRERISKSERSTVILRSATTFEEVLFRQLAESDVKAPDEGEADHLLIVNSSSDVPAIIKDIISIEQSLVKDI